jgi:stage II sporulation protein D
MADSITRASVGPGRSFQWPGWTGALAPCPATALIGSLILATSNAACVVGTRSIADPDRRAPTHLRVRVADGTVQRIPLEAYVRGAVIAELAPAQGDPSAVERMYAVQAIVARSYAVANLSRHQREGFDLCSTTHCQLYQPARLKTSTWARTADTAVQRTAGTVLWFGASAASTVFHADCGGHTSADGDIWGGSAHPYLRAIEDDGPARTAHGTWRFEVESTKLIAALDADERTRVGGRLREIAVLRRDAGGRAALVALRGAREPPVRGEELRAVLSRAFGVRSIRSTKFDVRRTGSTFVFTGQGFGHGVGLCQAGAAAHLRAGARPEQVLARYFPGTRLRALR